MKYCKTCLYPDTKPDLIFDDEGICSACRNYRERTGINWDERAREFEHITNQFRSTDAKGYDCLVPVSGGKDSTYQVIRVLQAGLNPLCVTATTDSLSDVGRRNIENLKRLGVDYIEVSVNPVVRRKLNNFGLREVGDISWPEHVTIFTIPVRMAVAMNIKLIIWGENPQNEYGGPGAAGKNNVLNRRWLEEFGGLLGLRVSDLLEIDGIKSHHLIQYTYPTDEELQRVGVTGIFLGHYFPWDGFMNALYAQAYGFEMSPKCVEGSLTNYENLDNYQTGIHDYFKYLKFGFGRATDIANNHLRRGRVSRRDAAIMVERNDGKFPWTYLGRPISEILAEIDMTVEDFIKICDRFTNKKIFRCDNRGNLIKDHHGNLIKSTSLLD